MIDAPTPPAEPVLEVTGLAKRYGAFTAVHDLSFQVARGEVLGSGGPNGAGKTSTLRCLGGILPPTHGTIRVAGRDLVAEPVAAKRTSPSCRTSRACSITSRCAST